MTEYYKEHYAGKCRCGHEVEAALKYRMGQNSHAMRWVRCAVSGHITNTRKVRE